MNLWAGIYRLLGYKTFDELVAECNAGKRRGVGRRDRDRAIRLELALLPKSTRFPHEGEVWEATGAVDVSYTVWYAAPGSASGQALLPAGERVVCRSARPPCVRASFDPVRYTELRDHIVAAELRTGAYTGTYSLSIKTSELNEHFRLIESPQSPPAGET